MLIEFDRYLNVRLCEGLYYVHVVNIDEAISQMGIVNLSVKFATAEGFFVKEYLLDEHGMRSFYDDFIADFYWTNLHPINDNNKESKFHFDLLDSVFDTNMHLLNREFEIVIEYIDGRNEITAINPCMIAHAMSQQYIKPFLDYIEYLDEKSWEEYRMKSDAESWAIYNENKSLGLDSDFEFGGLRGEEAETMYWNID
jgi:hypothetical protein